MNLQTHCYHQLTLVDADTRIENITEPLCFYQNVSPTKEIRDASNEAESQLRNFGVESSMRLDVFNAKTAAKKNIETSGQWDKLSPEQQRLVEKMVSNCAFGGFLFLIDLFGIRSLDLRWYQSRSCLTRGKEEGTHDSQEGTFSSLLGI